jgi:uncharacterized protein
MNTPLFTGLVLGFFGSLHCVGMCGPIVLALPGKNAVFSRFLGLRISYNLGRILGYSWLGLLVGLFGRQLQLAGLQETISISTGMLILVVTFFPMLSKRFHFDLGVSRLLHKLLGDLLHRPAYGSQLLTGLLNGLLPCGMVYLALAASLLLTNPLEGAAFMASFGMGTFPAMLAMAFAGRQLMSQWRPAFRRLSPVIATVMAVLFILRGMSLGIPYLSPELGQISSARTEAPVCH